VSAPVSPDAACRRRRQRVVWRVLVAMQLGVVLLILAALLAILLIGALGTTFQQRAA
jgi:hypothetical protein